MAHKQHEEFNEGVFRRLCDEALAGLPGGSRGEEVALDHLLRKVRNFCEVESVKIRDYRASRAPCNSSNRSSMSWSTIPSSSTPPPRSLTKDPSLMNTCARRPAEKL